MPKKLIAIRLSDEALNILNKQENKTEFIEKAIMYFANPHPIIVTEKAPIETKEASNSSEKQVVVVFQPEFPDIFDTPEINALVDEPLFKKSKTS